jgi:ABC-type transport system involved in multi-copper enzyme maturation permease subunit
MRILAVAGNTFREAVRDKVLYVLLFFAVVVILGSRALGWISVGQDLKIVKDFCLASMSVFGALIAIFVGTSLLYKEIDKKTLYTIISQPMHRYEFVLGKYLGLVALLALALGGMTALSTAYVLVLGGKLNLIFFQAALLNFWKLLLVTALAVLLSALTSPILGAILVFCAYVFGHATGVFLDLPPQFDGSLTKHFFEAIYYCVPNLDNFNLHSQAANDIPVSLAYTAWALAYGAAYSAVLLILACLAFEGKDL